MKAVEYRKNQGLVFNDAAPDPELQPDQVLIRVEDCGFCGSDHSMVESGHLPDGYILGHEFSGIVAEAGAEASAKAPATGSRVIVRPTFCGTCADCSTGHPQFCQVGRRTTGIGDLSGGFAEYVVAYPQMLLPVPDGVDSQNAALAEMFAASLHGLYCSRAKGGSALVLGGGPIGLALVKLLKIKGFGPVILSEPVAAKRELGLSLGADAALDPFNESIGKYVFEYTAARGFETVFECSGVPDNLQAGMDAAARFGTVCVVSVITKNASISPISLNFKEIWLTGAYGNTHDENRECLRMMADGILDGRSMISDLTTLEQLPGIYRQRIHTGQAVKVMVRIGGES